MLKNRPLLRLLRSGLAQVGRLASTSEASSSASTGATAAAPARQLTPRRRLPTGRLDNPLQPSAPSASTLALARATAERDALLLREQRAAEDFVVTKKAFLFVLFVGYFV